MSSNLDVSVTFYDPLSFLRQDYNENCNVIVVEEFGETNNLIGKLSVITREHLGQHKYILIPLPSTVFHALHLSQSCAPLLQTTLGAQEEEFLVHQNTEIPTLNDLFTMFKLWLLAITIVFCSKEGEKHPNDKDFVSGTCSYSAYAL